MLRYMIKQLIGLLLLLFFVSIAAFFLIRLLPGDPATAYLNSINAPLTEKSLAIIREDLGLDEHVTVQYLKWVQQVFHGDLGNSYQTKRAVTQELWRDLKYTAVLALATLAWVFILSIFLGLLSARYANRFADTIIRSLTFLGSSMPKFWLGFLLIFLFSLKWSLLPVQGAVSWRCLILPSFTLGCSYVATYTKLLRNSILEISNQSYVKYARMRGFSKRQVMWKHVLPNAAIPVVTTLGLHLGGILSGAVIVENVFSWPGLGRMCVTAVAARDYPMIQGYILLMALIYIVANLLSDLACAALNPKIRLEG